MGCIQSFPARDQYEGEKLNGKRHGQGTLRTFGALGETCYSGSFEKGVKCGFGTFQRHNYVYSGQWQDDKPYGEGYEDHAWVGRLESKYFGHRIMESATLTLVGKIVYTGRFDNGRLVQGTASYPSGAVYQGNFALNPELGVDDKQPFDLLSWFAPNIPRLSSSNRKLLSCVASPGGFIPNQDVFLRHGQGVFTLPTGVTYTGRFQYGEPMGPDMVLTLPNGISIKGVFRKGRACGPGILTIPKLGIRYEGGFVDNLPHGRGKLYYTTQLQNTSNTQRKTDSSLITVITYEGSWINGQVSTTSAFTITYPQITEETEATEAKTIEDALNMAQPNFVPTAYVVYQGRINEVYQRHGAGKCWVATSVSADGTLLKVNQLSGSAPSSPLPSYRAWVADQLVPSQECKLSVNTSETKTDPAPLEGKEVISPTHSPLWDESNLPFADVAEVERRFIQFAPSLTEREMCPLGGVGTGKLLVYSGDWRFDVPRGTGAAMLSDGSVHVGAWANGVPHGLGRLVRGGSNSSSNNGSNISKTQEGHSSTTEDANPTTSQRGKVVEGEWTFGVLTKGNDDSVSSQSKLTAAQMAELAQDLEWERRHSRLEDPCRYCGEREANCLFLECAHLIFCMECAEHMTHCALCDRAVMQRVHTYR